MSITGPKIPPLDFSRIELPSTPPESKPSSMTWSDVFEHGGSFHSFPAMPETPEVHASFNILEARQICENESCLRIMQEIAVKNTQFLNQDAYSYAFQREPIDLDLNQALQALELGGRIQVSIGKNPFHESPQIIELKSLSDLMRWWKKENPLFVDSPESQGQNKPLLVLPQRPEDLL